MLSGCQKQISPIRSDFGRNDELNKSNPINIDYICDMEINIQNTKIELIQWLATLEDKSIIKKIIDLRNNQTKDWWNEISHAEKKSIEKGIVDAEKGRLNPHSEVRKVYEKWL